MLWIRFERLCVKYVTVDKHSEFILPEVLFDRLLKTAITSIIVDESFYLDKYKDIKQAIAAGVVGGAKEHYRLFGYYENRQPYPIQVDSAYYLRVNSDVAEAIKQGQVGSAQDHFDKYGFREGRLPYPNFFLF